MKYYTQLTQEQQYQIWAYMEAGFNQAETAKFIGVDKSTLSREVRRNRGQRGYSPWQAHRFCLQRRQDKAKPRIATLNWRLIRRLLREDWSPEQISDWLAQEAGQRVNHEIIYQYVLTDKQAGENLYRHLLCQKQPRNVMGSTHIMARSRLTLLAKVARKTADAVSEAIIRLLKSLAPWVHTLTTDNGREFAQNQKIANALNAKFYFTHPLASWERGLNENTNGLIRQYFPQKHDFTTITQRQIERVMDKLNNRPRKCLGIKTPIQVFSGLNHPLH